MLGIGPLVFSSEGLCPEPTPPLMKLAQKYSSVKEGREGLNYSAASLLRMGPSSRRQLIATQNT
jgi:hypothetical protein